MLYGGKMSKNVVFMILFVLLLLLSGCIELNQSDNNKESDGSNADDDQIPDSNDSEEGGGVEQNDELDDFEVIGISNNGVIQTINYLEKPVKLSVSGSNCNLTVTKETNLIDIRISGLETIVRVSKSHSFTMGISGPGSEIIYYD
jgi:hypothetical protein